MVFPAPSTLTEIDDIYLGLAGIERPARTLPFRGLSWFPHNLGPFLSPTLTLILGRLDILLLYVLGRFVFCVYQ